MGLLKLIRKLLGFTHCVRWTGHITTPMQHEQQLQTGPNVPVQLHADVQHEQQVQTGPNVPVQLHADVQHHLTELFLAGLPDTDRFGRPHDYGREDKRRAGVFNGLGEVITGYYPGYTARRHARSEPGHSAEVPVGDIQPGSAAHIRRNFDYSKIPSSCFSIVLKVRSTNILTTNNYNLDGIGIRDPEECGDKYVVVWEDIHIKNKIRVYMRNETKKKWEVWDTVAL